MRVGFLTYFWRSSKIMFYSHIGPLSGAAMGQEALYIRYLRFLRSPHPLIYSTFVLSEKYVFFVEVLTLNLPW